MKCPIREGATTTDIHLASLSTLTGYFNATLKVLNNATSKGNKNPTTGLWDGMIGEVVHDRAHLYIWTGIVKELFELMIPSAVVMNDMFAFFSGLPQLITESISIYSKLDPIVCGCAMGCILLIMVVMLIIERERKKEIGLVRAAFWIGNLFRLMAQQNITAELDRLGIYFK